MKRYLIVATPAELELVGREDIRSRHVIITGVGGTNIIRALRAIPQDSDVLNVGYAGSLHYPVGTTVYIGSTRLWHPNVEFVEPTFTLDAERGALCLTAGDFVLDGKGLPMQSVVDMELAYIAAFGFARLRSVKSISDGLDLMQYEQNIKNK